MKYAKHLPALDGVRGLAVLIVVLYHTAGGAQSSNPWLRAVGTTVKTGWTGVTLFFLLSGFLITGILWDSKGQPHWWRNFYARRMLRIAPLYYGSLALAAVLGWVMHRGWSGSAGLWIFALYLQNLPWIADHGNATRVLPFFHFWSLAVEEQFYLIWPFLLLRLKSMGQVKFLCLALFVGSAVFRWHVWSVNPKPWDFNGFLLSRAGELALGGYLAMCFRDGTWTRLQRLAPGITFASLAGFVAVGLAGHTVELKQPGCAVLGLLFATTFFAGFIVLALDEGIVSRAMKAGWLRRLGSISYGVYVMHILFSPGYAWLGHHLAPHAGRIEAIAITGALNWTLTILAAWLSFRFFESPILRLRRHLREGAAIIPDSGWSSDAMLRGGTQ